MKRLIASIMILVFAMSGIVAVTAADDESENTKYLDFAMGVGVIEKSAGGEDFELTRAEFAQYIYRLVCGADDGEKAKIWRENVLDKDNYNTEVNLAGVKVDFDDVSESDDFYEAVTEMNRLKVMMGTGSKIFSPNQTITYAEAATAMVRLLGYNIYTKDSSYWDVANSLGILKGMKNARNSAVTRDGAAHIFYNCLDIDLLEVSVTANRELTYAPNKGKTIYTEYMDLYEATGTIEQNPFTSIYDIKGAGENSAVIDNVTYDISAVPELADYIGRNIEFYYQDVEEEDSMNILYFVLTGRDTAEKITADEFDAMDGYNISYYKNNKRYTKKLQTGAAVIYNGLLKTDYTEADFKIQNGDITLIKQREANDFNIVVINNYVSYAVTDVNKTEQRISAKKTAASNVKSFELSDKKVEPYRVLIYSKDGGVLGFDSVSVGNVIDVAENNGYYKIIVTDNSVSDVVAVGVSKEDEYVIISSADGTEYKISNEHFKNTGVPMPTLNGVYNLKLNSFDEVCYIEIAVQKEGKELVYLINVSSMDEDDYRGKIRYFTTSGNFKTLLIDYDFRAVLPSGTKMKIKDSTDVTRLVSYTASGTIAELEFNKDGKLVNLTLPSDKTINREGELGCIVENKSSRWLGLTSPKYFADAMLTDNSVLISVDTTQTEEKKRYQIVDRNRLADGTAYQISAYNYSSESVIADCVVLNYAMYERWASRAETVYLIEDIYQGIDEDDNEVINAEAYKIKYGSNMEKTALISEPGILDKAETLFDKEAGLKVKKGDVIMCEIFDGKVERAWVVFNIFDENKKYSPAVTGTLGYYTSDSKVFNTNPFNINTTSSKDTDGTPMKNSTMLMARTDYPRFFMANAYALENSKFLTYTSQPIDKGMTYDVKKSDERYYTETTVVPSKNIVVVSGTQKNMTVQNASVSDIKTYKNSGSNCSKLFLVQRYGRVYSMIIVNIEE